ncbi:MAG: Kelch repeat-containing protein [Candidatus Hermodarchaeota archaeon]
MSENSASRPSSRGGHALTYDSADQKVILFGGFAGPWTARSYFDDTWAYDYTNNSWINLAPTSKPSPRYNPAMTYDSLNQKLVLFGGYGFNGYLSDTWLYDYSTNQWTQVFPTTSPGIRHSHAMVYDSANQKIVLFGGHNQHTILNDTWVYDFSSNNWTEIFPETSPSVRYGHTMVYNPSNQKVILFGGHSDVSYREINNDLWMYDYNSNSWTEFSTATKPAVRYWHAMVYDENDEKMVLFGGWTFYSNSTEIIYDDHWTYDYALNQWTQNSLVLHPSARYLHSMVYDSVNQKVVLFGGYNGTEPLGDTWVYDVSDNMWSSMDFLTVSADFINPEFLLLFLGALGMVRWYKQNIRSRKKQKIK